MKYRLFFGKSGAILLGYSDTTQDVDLYAEKEAANCEKLVAGLLELYHFRLTDNELRGNSARQGFHSTERTDRLIWTLALRQTVSRVQTLESWGRHIERHDLPIANLDDIIGSKQAANRQKDKESLPRLMSFREWLRTIAAHGEMVYRADPALPLCLPSRRKRLSLSLRCFRWKSCAWKGTRS